jgi:hypothetical protein
MKRAFDKFELAAFEFLFKNKDTPLLGLFGENSSAGLSKNIFGKLTGDFIELVHSYEERISSFNNLRAMIKFFEEMT